MTDRHRVVVAALVYRWRTHDPVGGLLIDEPELEFLVIRRPPDASFYPNVWVAPGGGVELGDFVTSDETATVRRAFYRELTEEVGPVVVEEPFFLGARGFVRSDGTGVIVLTHCASWVGGTPTRTREAAEIAWVTAREAKEYDLVGSTLDEIERADAMLQETF